MNNYTKINEILHFSDVHPVDCRFILSYISELEHNWNELKKWLEEQDIFITELPVFMKEIEIEHKTMSLCYKNILDKMTELERGEE